MGSLRDELETIYERHGRLDPELLVETARPKTHPLHSQVFDRPPREAAEAWYRHRAHELIQSVKVVYKRPDGTLGGIRQWNAIRGESGTVYHPADKIAANPLLSELLRRDMEREWRQLFSRYERFEEFRKMIAETLAEVS